MHFAQCNRTWARSSETIPQPVWPELNASAYRNSLIPAVYHKHGTTCENNWKHVQNRNKHTKTSSDIIKHHHTASSYIISYVCHDPPCSSWPPSSRRQLGTWLSFASRSFRPSPEEAMTCNSTAAEPKQTLHLKWHKDPKKCGWKIMKETMVKIKTLIVKLFCFSTWFNQGWDSRWACCQPSSVHKRYCPAAVYRTERKRTELPPLWGVLH